MSSIVEVVKKAREQAKKRNFTQTFDLIVNTKGIDLKKPENRFEDVVFLPEGRGKEAKIAIFSDEVKGIEGCDIIKSSQIEAIGRNKREARKLANSYDFFFADPKLMPVVGRHLGQILGPRGKMPKPLVGDVKKLVSSYKNAVRIVLKKNPVIQTIVGTEDMKDESVAKNVKFVLDAIMKKLPQGKNNVRSVYLKLTMGKPVKVDVTW
ncbi:MAG: 50S ribosomal protein L1 [Candidatus Aenigmarchaeota archaeon]|nr:50S ribosomal protein L1 [Candidatus Aenigmarchaeota archaeon]